MQQKAKDALGYGGGALMAIAAVVIAGWLVIQVCTGIGNWWHGITYTSPEERAATAAAEKQAAEEWAKDPRNPKVAGQKCLDLGGIPDYSSWDGDVKSCNKPGGGNIDIKQSVEVKQ